MHLQYELSKTGGYFGWGKSAVAKAGYRDTGKQVIGSLRNRLCLV